MSITNKISYPPHLFSIPASNAGQESIFTYFSNYSENDVAVPCCLCADHQDEDDLSCFGCRPIVDCVLCCAVDTW